LFSEPFFTGTEGKPFEPVGVMFRENGVSRYGYTSIDTLRVVLEALVDTTRHAHQRCHLVVRPHPIECAAVLRPLVDASWPGVTVSIEAGESAAYWIGLSDGVLGMMGTALLEAALGGTPAISVQIGLHEAQQEDQCDANRLGYSLPVFHRSTLVEVLTALLTGTGIVQQTPRAPIAFDGATGRVADLVLGVPTSVLTR
jgi:hypothetical protein